MGRVLALRGDPREVTRGLPEAVKKSVHGSSSLTTNGMAARKFRTWPFALKLSKGVVQFFHSFPADAGED